LKNERRRQEIIDLDTGKKYLNESSVAEDLNLSRYFVHKSLTQRIACKGKMFAYYTIGINIEDLKKLYEYNSEKLLGEKDGK
jgi:hypothetical protein